MYWGIGAPRGVGAIWWGVRGLRVSGVYCGLARTQDTQRPEGV